MKERPILFSGPMVRAILSGRKTQTRRVVKGSEGRKWQAGPCGILDPGPVSWNIGGAPFVCPYGQLGDRLWVREAWNARPVYRADDGIKEVGDPYPSIPKEMPLECCMEYYAIPVTFGPFRPSIHMPRWASRITLEITGVSVERLQEITDEDAKREGTGWTVDAPGLAREEFSRLWQTINGPDSWDKNPWVWVLKFRVIKP